MIANFGIHPDKKLVSVIFTGNVVYEDIITWFSELHNHPDFSPDYNGVADLRNTQFGIERRDQPTKMVKKGRELAAYMDKINLSLKKWAIITDSPVETSLAILFAKEAAGKQSVEIFSTAKAAEIFLGTSLSGIITD